MQDQQEIIEGLRVDRKYKRPFSATPPAVPSPAPPPAATPHPGLLRAAQRVAAAPPERPGARRSVAQRGFDWCWPGVAGWGRGAPQGWLQGEGLGKGDLGRRGEATAPRFAPTQCR